MPTAMTGVPKNWMMSAICPFMPMAAVTVPMRIRRIGAKIGANEMNADGRCASS